MKHRSHVSLRRGDAMRIWRASTRDDKLVYVLVADKKLRYPSGRSRVAYIGTTKRGVVRVSSSVAKRAVQVFDHRGVHEFSARLIVCNPRQKVKMWRKLERAMLLMFREQYGTVPVCNVQGKGFKARDEFEYFARRRIQTILEDLS